MNPSYLKASLSHQKPVFLDCLIGKNPNIIATVNGTTLLKVQCILLWLCHAFIHIQILAVRIYGNTSLAGVLHMTQESEQSFSVHF